MCQELILPTTWPSLGPLDWTDLIPHLEMGVVVVETVAVEAEVVAEVAEERHHQGLEEQDMERLFLHMWTANYTARAMTSLQETNGRPENLSLSGTSTGALTSMQ